mgnify:CR=1 FL=1
MCKCNILSLNLSILHLNLELDALNVILYALDDGMTKLCALKVVTTGEEPEEERSMINVCEELNVQPVDEDIFHHPGRHRSNSVRNRIERMNSTNVCCSSYCSCLSH